MVNSLSGVNINNIYTQKKTCSFSGVKSSNSSVAKDTVSFTSKKNVDSVEYPRKKSSFVHKALVAATSAFVPGLGQALNGQWGKALFFAVGVPVATLAALTVSVPLAGAIYVASGVAMYVDAYRNA